MVVLDRAAFNQGENAQFNPYIETTDVTPPPRGEGTARRRGASPVDFRHMSVGAETDAANTMCAKGTGGWSLNYIPGVIEPTTSE